MKLSAVYCVRNALEFLPLSIATIIESVDELVIADNKSDDGTLEYCRTLRETHPKVKLVEMQTTFDDITEFATRNMAMEHVTGEWVVVLDSDQLLSDGWRAAVLPCLREISCEAIRVKYEHYVGSYEHIQRDFYERQKNPQANNYTPLWQTVLFRRTPSLKCRPASDVNPTFRQWHHASFDWSVPQTRFLNCSGATCFHYGFSLRNMMKMAVYRAGRGDHGHEPEVKAARIKELHDAGNPFLFCAPVVRVDYGPESVPSIMRDQFGKNYALTLDEQGFIKGRVHIPTGEAC